jgi:hypothetical protein
LKDLPLSALLDPGVLLHVINEELDMQENSHLGICSVSDIFNIIANLKLFTWKISMVPDSRTGQDDSSYEHYFCSSVAFLLFFHFYMEKHSAKLHKKRPVLLAVAYKFTTFIDNNCK